MGAIVRKNLQRRYVMIKNKKKYLNTTIHQDLIKSLKVLAVKNDVRVNALLEEAIKDILCKYNNKHM